MTIAIVLAVNWPPHAPAPGHAALSISYSSSRRDLAGPVRADRLEHGDDRRVALALVGARVDRAVVEDEPRDVEAAQRHRARPGSSCRSRRGRRPRRAGGRGDELDRVGDDLAADEDGLHALGAHRHAVADRDRVELHRRPAGGPDARPSRTPPAAAGCSCRASSRSTSSRRRRAAGEVVVREADRLEHRPRAARGPARRSGRAVALRAVGWAAVGERGLVGGGHCGFLPVGGVTGGVDRRVAGGPGWVGSSIARTQAPASVVPSRASTTSVATRQLPSCPVTASTNVWQSTSEPVDRLKRGDRRRPRHAAQERDLAHAVAWPLLVAGLAVDRHQHAAGLDHHVRLALLALGHDRLAGRVVDRLHPVGDPLQRGERQRREQRDPAQQPRLRSGRTPRRRGGGSTASRGPR